MSLLISDKLGTIKQYIYQNARLLERQLFEYFFGKGTKQACLKALMAYQNTDGGFGNGIEPDILCPASTAIGAETALFVLDLLETADKQILDSLVLWIAANINDGGFIPHPPQGFDEYPHQPWWKNADNERILALAGYLAKFGVKHNELTRKVRAFYEHMDMPDADNYYGYPYFIFLKYSGKNMDDNQKLETMKTQIAVILDKHADHFPLFSRAWYHANDLLDRKIVADEAQKFVDAITEDGSLDAPYPQLPWWRHIWTTDGLILLKRYGFI